MPTLPALRWLRIPDACDGCARVAVSAVCSIAVGCCVVRFYRMGRSERLELSRSRVRTTRCGSSRRCSAHKFGIAVSSAGRVVVTRGPVLFVRVPTRARRSDSSAC